tara:strand:+ start:284 stop:535 length:252 start_codon:yes stop_codon:yes gene_type:complete
MPDPKSSYKMANDPPHYTDTKIQPIDVVKDWAKGEDPLMFYFKSSILKYIKREKNKGKLQDIYKAEFFMKELVKAAEEHYGKN